MLERFNRYAKSEAKSHLKYFMRDQRFWRTMSNALLKYDTVIKANNVDIVLCSHFMDGAYLAKDNKVVLCANTLIR